VRDLKREESLQRALKNISGEKKHEMHSILNSDPFSFSFRKEKETAMQEPITADDYLMNRVEYSFQIHAFGDKIDFNKKHHIDKSFQSNIVSKEDLIDRSFNLPQISQDRRASI
jgi:hypothetical protein